MSAARGGARHAGLGGLWATYPLLLRPGLAAHPSRTALMAPPGSGPRGCTGVPSARAWRPPWRGAVIRPRKCARRSLWQSYGDVREGNRDATYHALASRPAPSI